MGKESKTYKLLVALVVVMFSCVVLDTSNSGYYTSLNSPMLRTTIASSLISHIRSSADMDNPVASNEKRNETAVAIKENKYFSFENSLGDNINKALSQQYAPDYYYSFKQENRNTLKIHKSLHQIGVLLI